VVLETLQLADLPGYTVGGSVHVIINNQVSLQARVPCFNPLALRWDMTAC